MAAFGFQCLGFMDQSGFLWIGALACGSEWLSLVVVLAHGQEWVSTLGRINVDWSESFLLVGQSGFRHWGVLAWWASAYRRGGF